MSAQPDHGKRGTSAPADGFFISGGTLSLAASSYIERTADKALFEALLAGKYCYVLNSRQMGKSSLCVRTKAKLEANGRRTAFVDLTRIGGKNVTPEQWYAALSLDIGRSLGLREAFMEFWRTHDSIPPMVRFFETLREVALERIKEPIVLLIDEIDSTRSLPFSADEFFAGIRESFNRRVHEPVFNRLTYCLLGVAVPSDLIRDSRTTPFNVGERIDLRDFTLEEALPLAAALGPNGEEIVRRVHYWTNGHPFLTQNLCQSLASNGHLKRSSDVDTLVRQEFLDPSARESNINLADVGKRVLSGFNEDDDVADFRANVLNAYGRSLANKEQLPDDESNRISAVLKLSGLMRTNGRWLEVRNRIYRAVFDRAWIKENMPGQELLRQRRAYRRGAFIAASISGIALLTLGALTYAAIGQANRADRNLAVARQRAHESSESEKAANLNAEKSKQAEARSNRLLAELNTALANLQRAVSLERSSRNLADRRTREAMSAKRSADANAARARKAEATAIARSREVELRSYDTYVANLKVAANAIETKQFQLAREILEAMRDHPRREWGYAMLRRSLQVKDRQLVGHKAGVFAIELSPDGNRAISAGYDNRLIFWDATSGTKRRSVQIGFDAKSMAVSWDANRIYLAGNDGALGCFEASTGSKVWAAKSPAGNFTSIALAPGNLLAACTGSGAYTLLGAGDGKTIAIHKVSDVSLNSIAVEPRSRVVALAPAGLDAFVCDLETGKLLKTLVGHTGIVMGAAFSSNGENLMTTSVDKTALLWDWRAGKVLRKFIGHVSTVDSTRNSEDGQTWVTASHDGTAKVWDNEGRVLETFLSHTKLVVMASASRVFNMIATASDDHSARVWTRDPTPGTKLLTQFSFRAYSVDAAMDGRTVLAGTADRARLIDALTGKLIHEFPMVVGSNAWGAALSPDARMAAFSDGRVDGAMVFDTVSFRELYRVPKAYLALRFSPDGKWLFADERYKFHVQILSAENGRPVRNLTGPTDSVINIQCSKDGKWVAAACNDGKAYLWNLTERAPKPRVFQFKDPVWVVAFSPDSQYLTAGDYGGVAKIFDISSGRKTMDAQVLAGSCEGVAFTPDSKELIVTGMRGDLSVISVPDGRNLVTFSSPTGQNRHLSMFPDGRIVVAGGDGTVRLWEPLFIKERK